MVFIRLNILIVTTTRLTAEGTLDGTTDEASDGACVKEKIRLENMLTCTV
jgi:hypothetical protein